jgi:hypothetical protein
LTMKNLFVAEAVDVLGFAVGGLARLLDGRG